jgi:GntR family transcriptional regulator, carbon starvation induced regulator
MPSMRAAKPSPAQIRGTALPMIPLRPAAVRPVESGESGAGPTLASLAYQRLREDILAGTLPPNEKLRMRPLQARYQMGLAPLREALARLHAENLVTSSDHRGFWVTPISVEELRDLTRIRMLLEGEALRESIAHGDDGWEADVISAFHRLARATERGTHLAADTIGEWEARHEEFHGALIAAADSRLLLRLRAMLAQLVRRYRRYAVASAGERDHLREHKAIMEATIGRDAARATRLLAEHYELTTKAILARYQAETA